MIVNNLADRVARLNKLISRERTYYDPPPSEFQRWPVQDTGNGRVVGARQAARPALPPLVMQTQQETFQLTARVSVNFPSALDFLLQMIN